MVQQPSVVRPRTGAGCADHGGRAPPPLPDRNGRSDQQELLVDGGSSEISDNTEELQMNLMRQVHEDVINEPDMLVREIPESTNSTLIQEIYELVKVT